MYETMVRSLGLVFRPLKTGKLKYMGEAYLAVESEISLTARFSI